MSEDRARGFPAFPAGSRGGGKFAKTWWGNAWITAMEDTALDGEQLRKGRRRADSGHVGTITVSPGRIDARVHDGDEYSEYGTVLRFSELSDPEWDRLLDRVAAKAGHIAALLDGDIPHELVETADDAGVRLLPGYGDLDPECDCPGWEHPCRHAAALAYQAAWLLDADPFMLLLIRGRERAELLAELRARGAQPPAAERAGTAVAEAYARVPGPLPEIPAETGPPMDLAPLLPADATATATGLAVLAADAAERAAALLAGADLPELDAWTDAVRLAATHPAATAALTAASGRADLPDAAAAWAQGGADGLRVWTEPWTPPAAAAARVRVAVEEAVADGLLDPEPEVRAWRNRWTVAGRAQLRLGTDGRWYPYARAGGRWRPRGTPRADPVTALAESVRR
ncbi:SWIM zinc finger family protein [Actinokineospora sp. NBRC 105648]|uniref:SWIM zinc finger family protein n=1 Tax=Actinokineospora sp. NBRC 105648 TaxID=3032206 RepID=UPI0024A46CF0|nr:SWIM zinc finger family protein [Actinokineospora sp. NBRC 105648]GLZ41856.1 hypothetical protein Acsp05_54800 [Actinokineospora sp. NBRC 105648]